ncbi:Putative white-brown complex homolog protein 30 [Seminavis robusta]|uniref:White-brown complex homolog protein 30 n=1 Tax=Seminavis robusta TaxID=568900 RepID=A0A9N8DM53_9STRA|nr:Putative white-brown complex homolog protein 30 [Seminavis robusta]|eukprot:Sro234_g094520.1 Putative white-brown complex homolog protein 30 (694) ;mRNA; r:62231-64801
MSKLIASDPSITSPTTGGSAHGSTGLGNSSRRSGMESSVLRFKNVNFVAGKGKNEKHILRDVSGRVSWGHVLAIMGPSGAGKTTLISSLTLDAHYGTPSGAVTLNGVPLTDNIFKKHCYVVKQHDKHWPYLTARESLLYAADLFEVADKSDIPAIVDDIIHKMGLDICADTRCARLSGGQARRLSIAMALLKQPTLLFLDEPTSGLDAAAAENIMKEIVRVAKDERIIIVCTIHQPSTKVYNGFDQLMIMSKGREVFAGDVADSIPYFESIGHPCPPDTNPAEYFLDLANADFSDDKAVEYLLDTWEERKPGAGHSSHHGKSWDDDDGQEGVTSYAGTSFFKEMGIMMKRHATLIIRDPILYLGRCAAGLLANIFFAFVYWNARVYEQEQVLNKMWVIIWFSGVITNMAVVAVYALNDEFKSIVREAKNGMVTGFTYVMAKNVLTLPFILLLSVCCLGIPGFVIMDFPAEGAKMYFFLFAAMLFVFESVSEFFSILFDDPILGMLQLMNFWFASFLFGGFVIPLDDMYYPWTIFYYIMPFSYFVRSALYETLSHATFATCEVGTQSAVCIQEETPGAGVPGIEVLRAFERVMPIAEAEDNTVRDTLILIGIGLAFKLLYTVGVILKTRRVAKIQQTAVHSYTSSSKKSNVSSGSIKSKKNVATRTQKPMIPDVVSSQAAVGLPAEVYSQEIEV